MKAELSVTSALETGNDEGIPSLIRSFWRDGKKANEDALDSGNKSIFTHGKHTSISLPAFE